MTEEASDSLRSCTWRMEKRLLGRQWPPWQTLHLSHFLRYVWPLAWCPSRIRERRWLTTVSVTFCAWLSRLGSSSAGNRVRSSWLHKWSTSGGGSDDHCLPGVDHPMDHIHALTRTSLVLQPWYASGPVILLCGHNSIYSSLIHLEKLIYDEARPLYPLIPQPPPFLSCSFAKWHLTLRPHGLQHARLLYPLLSPRVSSTSCLLSRSCYLSISSSAAPSPLAFSLPQHWGLFRRVCSSYQVA